MESSGDLYCMTEIASHFWEPFIISGYRKPGISVKDSARSIFKIHNETLNIWTHFLPCLYTVWHLWKQPSCFHDDLLQQPYVCLLVSVCAYTFGSSVAHTFCSISEFSQHVSFMIDYYCISLYAFSISLTNVSYSFPKSWQESWWESCFLYATGLCCIFSVFLSCQSRFRKFDSFSKVMRVVAFLLPYLVGMAPTTYRTFLHFSRDDATFYFSLKLITSLLTVTLYSTHFPECLYPGSFDYYFHSHQLFHLGVVATTYCHIQGMLKDMEQITPDNVVTKSLYALLIITLMNGTLLSYYIYKMYLLHCNHDSNQNSKKLH
ncbi:membrane progestin receptor delta-like [Watersipora subatra]|uniref:membrane progestin receptor delta-like n=1 Tax=Watersipora subatra TaxID=2589382 RepID=UPI00355AD219